MLSAINPTLTQKVFALDLGNADRRHFLDGSAGICAFSDSKIE
ncbi:hypothetical protein HDEF_2161 [Candidatus Hamiltonella defensa 5AT (Acyrthosiphon pisum)]|uniref:Uncharacterized protein n=1 Tax=Hamiltonella defensa subsp. Acyrthosiphon pisum (strain 5AT) TaxID=572265 RepID=C4K864_HAMD5|nr:hypothetical protein HDEF_2161 [Candidatus Hamiltonella defensa 5AT (Acyrthosiphon pisum)]